MGLFAEAANGIVTESAANTINYANVEVPNSAGAKKVMLRHAELDLDQPNRTTAGVASCQSTILVGKQAPTTVALSGSGCLFTTKIWQLHDGTNTIGLNGEGPVRQNDMMVPIGKDADGKYYVTVAVKGLSNAAAVSVNYRLDFLVERS